MAELTPQQAKEVVFRARPLLISKKGVVSVGYGLKRTRGQFTDTHCIVVYVTQKMPLAALNAEDVIPFEVEGVPTDVVLVREVSALIFHAVNYARKRPCPGGYSIGHPLVTAGTLGLPVVVKEGQQFLLSNAHVLAPHWKGEVKAGQSIYQPGPMDGGRETDAVAALDSWVTLDFSGAPNRVDGALARIFPSLVEWRLEGLEPVYEKAGEAQAGTGVIKVGRTTGLTRGQVAVVGAAVRVNYGDSFVALFVDQLEIVATGTMPFSQGGDSGSAILSEDGKEVLGLLFAGDDISTFANPIRMVQEALGFEVMPQPKPETIEKQLEGLRESLVVVWRWEARGKQWLFYDPRVPDASTLKILEKGKGYWVQVVRDIAFSYHDFTYDLAAGWNQLGFVG